jgi:hypothetical protein
MSNVKTDPEAAFQTVDRPIGLEPFEFVFAVRLRNHELEYMAYRV